LGEIGARLLEERQRLNLSQTEMGKIGGVSINTYFTYEKGAGCPDAECLARLYQAGVDVLYVLTGVRNHTVLSNKVTVLLEQFSKLDVRMQDAILALMQTYNGAAE
jgi:transcriptional regulator with XRE-family HTH domain